MTTWFDVLTFGVLPYAALAVFLVVTVLRYLRLKFTYSSFSSQFLENRHHFWGLVPFHYGLLTILLGHLIGFLVPRTVLAWNGEPVRLWILETSALVFGLLALVGLANIIWRRSEARRLRIVTSPADWILYGVLLFQIATGVGVAVFVGWGTSWYAAVAAPYLWSLFGLNPAVASMAPLPLLAKLHVLSAWLLVGFFPFTRLVHVLVVPNMYLWRKPQVVRWLKTRGREEVTG